MNVPLTSVGVFLLGFGIALLYLAATRAWAPLAARRRAVGSKISGAGVPRAVEDIFPRSVLSDEGLVWRRVQVKRKTAPFRREGDKRVIDLVVEFEHEVFATFRLDVGGTPLVIDPAQADRASTLQKVWANELSDSARGRALAALEPLGYAGTLDGYDLVIIEESLPAEHRVFVIGRSEGRVCLLALAGGGLLAVGIAVILASVD